MPYPSAPGTAVVAAGGSGAIGSGLAVTGFNSLWLAVAGFTLITAGFALLRMAPRLRFAGIVRRYRRRRH